MQQFFNNRYVQIAGLTLGLALVFGLVLWLVFSLLGWDDFPPLLVIGLSVLGAGLIVYKFFAHRIF